MMQNTVKCDKLGAVIFKGLTIKARHQILVSS